MKIIKHWVATALVETLRLFVAVLIRRCQRVRFRLAINAAFIPTLPTPPDISQSSVGTSNLLYPTLRWEAAAWGFSRRALCNSTSPAER